MKRFVLRLLGVSLSVVFGLGIAEVALRFLPAQGRQPRSTSVEAATTAWFWQPDFRGRPRPSQKPSATFRVVVAGDSFTWGSGVHPEDVYSERLERRLNELESEVEFEVVNWSHTGWNTHQAVGSLRRALRWLEPDLLILGFVLNDAEPVSLARRQRMQRDLERRSPGTRVSVILHGRSRLYRTIWERLENTRQRRAFIAYYHSLYEGPGWVRCRSALTELRDRSRRRSIPMLLVIFPVFDSQFDDSYPYAKLHGKVRAAAKKLEIPALDLLRTYRGIDARRLAVMPFTNPHPNELAHRIAADRLVTYLLKKGLVPARRLEAPEAHSGGPGEGLSSSDRSPEGSRGASADVSESRRPESMKGEAS